MRYLLLLLVACSKPDPTPPPAPAPAPAPAPDARSAPDAPPSPDVPPPPDAQAQPQTPSAPTRAPAPQFRWQTDEPSALAAATRARKPVLLDFTAEWCVPCHEYDAKLFAAPAVRSALAARFVSIRVDVTNGTAADEAIMESYGVTTLPHVLLRHSDGSEARRYDQPIPTVKDFLNALSAVN